MEGEGEGVESTEGDSGFVSFFKEANECEKAIQSLVSSEIRLSKVVAPQTPIPSLASQRPPPEVAESQSLCERLEMILAPYQEQPHLLDPHLDKLVAPLIDAARKIRDLPAHVGQNGPRCVPHNIYRVLYFITKVRGPKSVVKFFSHEASDLEPTLALLRAQDRTSHNTWETRYVLLLWLSILCLIPFDLKSIDSSQGEDELVDELIDSAKSYLAVAGKERESAALLLAKVLTRPDVVKSKFSGFITWTEETLKSSSSFLVAGTLQGLSAVFRYGKREDLLEVVDRIYPLLAQVKKLGKNNVTIRKLWVKLTQRIGLCYLRPKVAAWRYQRGRRILMSTAGLAGTTQGQVSSDNTDGGVGDDENEEEEDIADAVEEIIGVLLESLGDKSTVVRWSAAKGIGRVTERLPKYLGDDVVGSVIQSLGDRADSDMWHGGCLALAELARRGLLLPARLPLVVPVVLKGLQYDVRSGAHSVGANVRDSACYVCWAFARAYDPEMLAPFVLDMAKGLLITTVFDREVNCRRAASAAFQENVGRQGLFLHGIDILTAADYFTVGNRNHAYTDIAAFVAQFDEYRTFLISHLVEVKVRHWDKAIRIVTAEDYMRASALPALIAHVQKSDLNTKHGGMLAIGSIVNALSICAPGEHLTPEIASEIENLIPALQQAGVFAQFGSEFVREGACCLIEELSLANFPLREATIQAFQAHLDENINKKELDLRDAAIKAIRPFVTWAYSRQSDQGAVAAVVGGYLQHMQTGDMTTKRGFPLALGRFPHHLLGVRVMEVVEGLRQGMEIYDKGDAEARQNCALGLFHLCRSILDSTGKNFGQVLSPQDFQGIFGSFMRGLNDYTVDSRGDVGSWKREVSIRALETLLPAVVSLEKDSAPGRYVTREMVTLFVGNLMQQAVEKMDKIRGTAGEALQKVVHQLSDCSFAFDYAGELAAAIPKALALNWTNPAESAPVFVPLLALPPYAEFILVGLIVSIGGLTESTVKATSSTLLKFLKDAKALAAASFSVERFASLYVTILENNRQNIRVVLPALITLDLLFSNDIFSSLPPSSPLMPRLLLLIEDEISKSKDTKKILAAVPVFCGFLSVEGDVQGKALTAALNLLISAFPKVRTETAAQLYTALLTIDGLVSPELQDEVTTLLTESKWDDPLAVVKPLHATLCAALVTK